MTVSDTQPSVYTIVKNAMYSSLELMDMNKKTYTKKNLI